MEEKEFKPMVGYAYVMPQVLGETYPIDKALEVGTLFPELNIGQYVPKQSVGGSL